MANVSLHPLIKALRGKMKGIVFRPSHNGKISAFLSPDMSRVKWSAAQEAQRERFAEASAYAKAAVADPQIRAIYAQRSMELKQNNRPYDMALSDYCNGNNLLGDNFRWDAEHWRAMRRFRKRKKP